MADEQQVDLKALLLRIEALELKVGIYGTKEFINSDNFEEFIQNYDDFPPIADVLRGMDKDILIGCLLESSTKTLKIVKSNVSKHVWEGVVEDIENYVSNGVDKDFCRKRFFETLNRAIAQGSFWYLPRDKDFDREAWSEEYRRREEERKKEEAIEEAARLERLKPLAVWKKEVFDQLDKA